jgi:ribosomal protein S18 acetylase RimI-like enzyme
MLTITRAQSYRDFEIAAEMGRVFGAWDAEQGRAYGLDEETILLLFHNSTIDSLTEEFTGANSSLMIARWSGEAAGCLGFEPFDDTRMELKNFFVDPAFRGRNIGRSLLSVVLEAIEATGSREIVLHTTVYMVNAISLYTAFGFQRCEAFRDIPDSIRHTEVFMRRQSVTAY